MSSREWELEVTLSCARGLQKKSMGAQNPYCILWYAHDEKETTTAHKKGGTNPTWNKVVGLPVTQNQLTQMRGSVTVEIYHDSHGLDSLIGTAKIPLSVMTDHQGSYQTYEVDPQGEIEVALTGKEKAVTRRGAATSGGGRVGQASTSTSGLSKAFKGVVSVVNAFNSLSQATKNVAAAEKTTHGWHTNKEEDEDEEDEHERGHEHGAADEGDESGEDDDNGHHGHRGHNK